MIMSLRLAFRSLFLLPLVLLYVGGYQIKAAPIKALTKIKHAKVFLSGATLVAEATAKVPKGDQVVILTGLPNNYDYNSVEIKVKGKAFVLGYKPSQAIILPKVNPNQKKQKGISTIIKELEGTVNRLNIAKVEVQELRLEVDLQLSALHAHQNMDRKLSTLEIKQFLDYIEVKLNLLRAKRLKYNQQERDLTTKIQQKQAYIEYLRNGGLSSDYGKDPVETPELTPEQQDSLQNLNPSQQQLEVSLQAEEAGDVYFEVSYNISEAGWAPHYDLKVAPGFGPIKIIYRAQVRQSTGINWRNVGLTLSTTAPSANRSVPGIEPYTINLMDPAPPRTYMPRPAMRRKLSRSLGTEAPMMDEAKEESMALAVVAPSFEVSETTISTEYDIDLKYNIQSGNEGQRIQIRQMEAKARYEYASVPRSDPAAFLVAYISGWESYSLLPAEASIYLDGSFVGTQHTSFDSPDEELQISLARDPAISVKRVNKAVKKKGPTILEGSNEKEYVWETTIRNNRSDVIKVSLKDVVPISGNEELKVEVKELSKGNLIPDTGIAIWDLSLKAGETKKVTLKYLLTYPKKKVLVE